MCPGYDGSDMSSESSSPVLWDFSDDTLSEARTPTKRPRARRNATKSKRQLHTPAQVGDLDLDAIHAAIREAALDYTRRGWRVIQVYGMVATADGDLICECRAGAKCGTNSGKHPRGVAGLFERATSDPEVVAQWWDEHPNSNVGLVGRDPIGVIIDLDHLKEGETGRDGFELWQELEEQYGPAPETFTEISGSGGQHIFFAVKPDMTIDNSLPVISSLPKTSSGKVKIDVKGPRGFVVAAPSLHLSGNLYRVTQDLPLAVAPDWLVSRSLTSSLGQRGPKYKTASPGTQEHSKKYDARIQGIMDELLAKMTDEDAALTSTMTRLIHHGSPGDQSVVTQRIITGVSAKNLHPDMLFGMLCSPHNEGGAGLQRRIKERGIDYGYEWMATNYREAFRNMAVQVAAVQDIRADIDQYEWTRAEFGPGGRGHRASPESMKVVLRAVLDIAEEQTSTYPLLSKTEIAKRVESIVRSRQTVWAAIQGLIELGWLEVHIKPKQSDAVWTYRFPSTSARKNRRILLPPR